MKIKIIDLFNKIANDEEVPNPIMLNNVVFHYDDDAQDYENGFEYLFRDSFSNFGRSDEFLNIEVEEVEIIEEEKELEKIRMNGNCFFSESINAWINKEKSSAYCEFLSNKINELVDEINKLKKEK